MGVEETSPENPRMIDGYSISKRIAPYVSKVSDFDLKITDCAANLTYAYTHSALVYLRGMSVKDFNRKFSLDAPLKSREEIAKNVNIKTIFDSISKNGQGIPLFSYAVYLSNQGVLINDESFNKLIAISGKHFANEYSTWGDYVGELTKNKVFNFNACGK